MVVGILAVLAAIAIPSFLDAQTRSKVSAAQATLRTGIQAMEMYAVDNNRYPSARPRFPEDPLGILAHYQLTVLSTPVAYLSSSSTLRDPFGTIQLRGPEPLSQQETRAAIRFPELTPPNQSRSLLYYHYPNLAIRFAEPSLHRNASALLSIGPDLRDSLGAFLPSSPDVFANRFARGGIRHPLDTVYDPTNGTISEGDITRFAGRVGGRAR